MTRRAFVSLAAYLLASGCERHLNRPFMQISYAVSAECFQTARVVLAQNADTPKPAASVAKLLIAIAIIEREPRTSAGDMNGAAFVTRNCFVAANRYFPGASEGARLPIYWLLSRMIQQSDNFSANVLIEHVGVPAINAAAAALGLKVTRIHGLFYDAGASTPPRAFTTGRECNVMLRHIVERSRQHGPVGRAYDGLIGMMANQEDRRFIPNVVPLGVVVADKTGEIAGQINDASIIDPFGGHPILFSVMASGTSDPAKDPAAYDQETRRIRDYIAHLYERASICVEQHQYAHKTRVM